jgi:hypothetical protein|tara:strand:+ start:128 stop:286 length:159 start_codon:yes stop_codon:yes gene_type:complete
MKRLDKIANVYHKCGNKEMKEMWKEKWHELVRNVARRHREMYPKFKEDRLNK